MRIVLLSIFLAAFSSPIFAQVAAPLPLSIGIEEVYLAKDNGEGRAGDEATEFAVTDIPIYCVVLLDISEKVTVKMNFVAVKVAGVRPETKVVTASYTTKEGQNRVNFTGRPEGRWTPGKYRVDLFLDGKPAKTVEFEIKGSGVNLNSSANNLQSPPIAKPRPKQKTGKTE